MYNRLSDLSYNLDVMDGGHEYIEDKYGLSLFDAGIAMIQMHRTEGGRGIIMTHSPRSILAAIYLLYTKKTSDRTVKEIESDVLQDFAMKPGYGSKTSHVRNTVAPAITQNRPNDRSDFGKGKRKREIITAEFIHHRIMQPIDLSLERAEAISYDYEPDCYPMMGYER